MSMKSLKLDFIDDNIKYEEYEEYCFNGIQASKDIQINNIRLNNCNISWKLF